MTYWLWHDERQTRVREAATVPDHLVPRPSRRIRLPRLLAVRTVPPGRPDATQSGVCAAATQAAPH